MLERTRNLVVSFCAMLVPCIPYVLLSFVCVCSVHVMTCVLYTLCVVVICLCVFGTRYDLCCFARNLVVSFCAMLVPCIPFVLS